MKKCVECRGDKFVLADVWQEREFGGCKFGAMVAGQKCEKCSTEYVGQFALERFEELVALNLVRTGQRSGKALKFLRKYLGITASDLAQMLGVEPETVSRWENEKNEADPTTMITIAALVEDKAAEERLALAEKEWRSTFRRRAKIMESALGAAASLDAPTPETDEEP